MSRHRQSLNEISHKAAIELLRALQLKGFRIKEVYIDTVGPPEHYQTKMKKLFPNIEIVVSKRADSLYPIVSAASICAKVYHSFLLTFDLSCSHPSQKQKFSCCFVHFRFLIHSL
jgi:ribonuclease H2 subunit A